VDSSPEPAAAMPEEPLADEVMDDAEEQDGDYAEMDEEPEDRNYNYDAT